MIIVYIILDCLYAYFICIWHYHRMVLSVSCSKQALGSEKG
jgi:hypothetical protein